MTPVRTQFCHTGRLVVGVAVLLLAGCAAISPLQRARPLAQVGASAAPEGTAALVRLGESPLQLADVLAVALRQNPELRASEARWLAAEERPAQARSLEDPQLGYGFFARSVETRVGPQEHQIGLAQKFPFFGKLRLRGEAAAGEAARARADYDGKRVEIVARVKSVYYELHMAHKAIEITQENQEILRRFARIVTSKYAAGKVPQQDVLKAQLELSDLANELLTLWQRKDTAEAALNVLLDRPPDAPLGRPPDFTIPPFTRTARELRETALARSPVLRGAEADVGTAGARLALARREYYPDFVVGLDYIVVGGGTTPASEDGKDAVVLRGGVTLPIWRGRLLAAEREAVQALEAARASRDAATSRVLFEVSDGLTRVRTAAETVKLYETTLVPQAEQSLKAATIAYEADRADFLNLLDSQRALLDFRLGYHRALVDFQQRLAELERAVGSDLLAE